MSSTPMDFRKHVRDKVIKTTDRILEFGPLTRPTVTRDTHPHVYFADIRSTDDVKKLYTSNDYLKATGITVDLESIVDIDYVISSTYKETFKNIEKFDVVILSHVIEHMPDIIEFFQDISNILADNGRLVIIYPDARFCFDHFRNGTSFVDAYDVHKDKKNLSKRVFDFVYNVVSENDPVFFWQDDRENSILPKNDFKESLEQYRKARNGKLPDDVHFWPFSDHQLIKFLYDMDRAGLLQFDIDKFYTTGENTQEFMVILTPKKTPGVENKRYKKMLDKASPSIKNIKQRQSESLCLDNIESLEKTLAELSEEKERLEKEISAIYGSKKWRYVEKIATIKSKLSLRRPK